MTSETVVLYLAGVMMPFNFRFRITNIAFESKVALYK